jgi:hypothetical protein
VNPLQILRWYFGLLLLGLWDGVLVSLGFKWQPPTGRPRWRDNG